MVGTMFEDVFSMSWFSTSPLRLTFEVEVDRYPPHRLLEDLTFSLREDARGTETLPSLFSDEVVNKVELVVRTEGGRERIEETLRQHVVHQTRR